MKEIMFIILMSILNAYNTYSQLPNKNQLNPLLLDFLCSGSSFKRDSTIIYANGIEVYNGILDSENNKYNRCSPLINFPIYYKPQKKIPIKIKIVVFKDENHLNHVLNQTTEYKNKFSSHEITASYLTKPSQILEIRVEPKKMGRYIIISGRSDNVFWEYNIYQKKPAYHYWDE